MSILNAQGSFRQQLARYLLRESSKLKWEQWLALRWLNPHAIYTYSMDSKSSSTFHEVWHCYSVNWDHCWQTVRPFCGTHTVQDNLFKPQDTHTKCLQSNLKDFSSILSPILASFVFCFENMADHPNMYGNVLPTGWSPNYK